MTSGSRVDTEAITARLTAYNKHKNDPYAYYEGEIKAVRELRRCAPGDIAVLLAEVARLWEALKLAWSHVASDIMAAGPKGVYCIECGGPDNPLGAHLSECCWSVVRAALQTVEETP